MKQSGTFNEVHRIAELREKKSELLFEFLRRIQEINRQIKVNELKQEVAQINREGDKALMEILLRDGK